jgi:fatty-acyl-CoA synthase
MRNGKTAYDTGLDKNKANYVPLSPLSFLERSAQVHPKLTSVVYEDHSFTWAETYARARRFASMLAKRGIGRGDTVAAMLPNVPAMYEAHFAIPMVGAVINALNTRLDAPALAFMLDHGEAKVLLVDPEHAQVMEDAMRQMKGPKPFVIDVDDKAFSGGQRIGEIEYESWIAQGDPKFSWSVPEDEWDAIALSYTSGTTGNPKGVVTHHRGAYLNAVSNIVSGNLGLRPVYLWTLPMFHCNGWCFPWTLAAASGVNVCLRKVDPAKIFELIPKHGVTHMCGAPIVYATLISAPSAPRGGKAKPISGLIAGAPPPVAVIQGAEEIGITLTHVYGLTEVYGPASVCAEQPGWDDLPIEQRAVLKRRQGVAYHLQDKVTVLDPETMKPGATRWRDHWRGHVPWQHRDEGLSEEREGHRRVVCRWLVPHRRSRRDRFRRLHHHQGSLQGHHHLRRREHFVGRGRGRVVQASGGAVRGRGGQARQEMGRGALRVRRAEGRRQGQ